MHLHEVDVDEEGLRRRLRRVIKKFQCRLFDVAVEERNADDTSSRQLRACRHTGLDLELLDRFLASLAGQRARSHPLKHGA